MEFTVKQVSDLIGGRVEGISDSKVRKLSKIEEGESGSLCFLSNEKYQSFLYTTKATAVIVAEDLRVDGKITSSLIRVKDPRLAFAKLMEQYQALKSSKRGIEQPSFISPSAKIGENVFVGAMSYIGDNARISDGVMIMPGVHVGENVTIGEKSKIGSGCRIESDTQIGKHCHLQPGVVLGGDGFGFAPNSENQYQKVVHIGNVIIEDCVEIGANTTIDRATMGSTIIRKGVKLDNLIQIAHNVEIGENTVIAAQCGIAGSTKIGKNCMIGGQVGIVGHITIADEVKIAAQSGIGQSIEEKGAVVQGSPAMSIQDFRRSYVVFKKLPQFSAKIDLLQKSFTTIK